MQIIRKKYNWASPLFKRNKTNKVQNQCVAKKQNNLKAFSENFKVSNTIFKIRKQEELIKF